MTTKGDSSGPIGIVPPRPPDEIPPHWPECPNYLKGSKRARFLAICGRLDSQGTLEAADVSKIEALAVAEDKLEATTTELDKAGEYRERVKQGRPYQCPACKGSGIRPVPKGQPPPAPSSQTSTKAPGRPPGRPCTICNHARRAEIEEALGRGLPFRKVAERFGVSTTSAHRHKRDHLGKPQQPTLLSEDDRTCLGCKGTGVIVPETTEREEKHPAMVEQRHAIDLVNRLSTQLGLDVVSRVRVKGKPREQARPSRLMDLAGRRGLRK